MRGLTHALSIMASVILSGRFFPVAGDGAFSVKGQVPTDNGMDCEVRLADAGVRRILEKRKIKSAFSVTFVVASSAATYVVQEVCNGVVRQAVQVEYGSDVGPGDSVTLSNITM